MHALKHTIVHMKKGELNNSRGKEAGILYRIMALPAWASVIIALAAALLVAVLAETIFNRFTRKAFKPAGKHCFVTGGSTGLGKALAIELVKKGANVTIVARRQSELDKAAKEIEVCPLVYQKMMFKSYLKHIPCSSGQQGER